MFLFAKMPAMIADQHYVGFTSTRVFLQLLEEPTDLTVNKCDGCLIGADGGIPLIVRNDVLVIA